MPVITKNLLVCDKGADRTYRVLDKVSADSPETDDFNGYVVLIDIDQSTSRWPEYVRADALLERLGSARWRVVKDQQPSLDLEMLTPAQKRVLDSRWDILQRAIKSGRNLYLPGERAALARRFAEEGVACRPLTYLVLRLYWAGGAGKQSLVPRFDECGAPGESRVPNEGDPKVGRKRTTEPGVGAAMTEWHRRKMSLAIATTPVGKDGRWLQKAYYHLLIKQYPECVRVEPDEEAPVIELPNSVPSSEQFHYHWKKQHSLEERLRKRLRTRRFEQLTKVLSSGTLRDVRGPGSRYYIDATIVDAYAVSRFNRNRIIGRPTLYLVVDQFSRLIVGVYLGLEPPCWAGAMLALWNCNIDKVALCAKYGITITPDQWPTGYMPMHLMGDRGELMADYAEALSAGFNIDIENAPPYKGEAKGVVERCFGTLQAIFGPYMPGYVDKEFLGRDADPAQLAAAADLDQFMRVILASCIMRNHHVIRDYGGSPEQIVEGVEYTPLALWHWGRRHLLDDSRQFTQEHLARYLWPEAKLKLTRRGLQFYRGLWYFGANIAEQPWFVQAIKEEQEFRVRAHPQQLSQLLLLPNEERSDMLATTISPRSERFATFSLSELRALESQQRRRNAKAKWENLPVTLEMTGHIERTVAEAKSMAKTQRDPSLSDAQRMKQIRENRASEVIDMTGEALGELAGSRHDRIIDMPANEPPAVEARARELVAQLLQDREQKA